MIYVICTITMYSYWIEIYVSF